MQLVALGAIQSAPPLVMYSMAAFILPVLSIAVSISVPVYDSYPSLFQANVGQLAVLASVLIELVSLNQSRRACWKVKLDMEASGDKLWKWFADLIPHQTARMFLLLRLNEEMGLPIPEDLLEKSAGSQVIARSHLGVLTWCSKPSQKAIVLSSDLVGFTPLAQRLGPINVVNMLHDLWCHMDMAVSETEMFKMDTIGDAYVVVHLVDHPTDLVLEEASLSVFLLAYSLFGAVTRFVEDGSLGLESENLKIRMGMHVGPVASGLVGLTQPRYHVFGPTISMAAQMESQSKPGHILVSPEVAAMLLSEERLFDLQGLTERKHSKLDNELIMKRNNIVSEQGMFSASGAVGRRKSAPVVINYKVIEERLGMVSTSGTPIAQGSRKLSAS